MEIDVIGADEENDDESIETWMDDETERRMRNGRDPVFDYMKRDPRNPETYPIGSGGEMNYGIRIGETTNPKHTSRETFMGVPSGGRRGRLHAQMRQMTAEERALASGKQVYTTDEEMTLASLGFNGHSGLGGDDAIYGGERMQTIFVDTQMGFLGDSGMDCDEIADSLIETFLTPRFDGLAPTDRAISIASLGALKLPSIKIPKLPNVGKAVSKSLAGASKSVQGAAKALNDGYKKVCSAIDPNKGNKNKMIAEMNQIRGRIQAIEARGVKSPKSQARLKELKAEYAAIAKDAAKEKLNVDKMEEGQKDMKAAGVAAVVGLAVKAKTGQDTPATKKLTETAEAGKLKGLSDEEIGLIYLGALPRGTRVSNNIGIAPVIAAIVVGGVVVAAVAIALAAILKKSGKLKTKVETSEKEINTWENNWTAGEKVPFDPKTQAYTEVIKDPDSGKVLGVRTGDVVKYTVDTGTHEMEKAKAVATEQSGESKVQYDAEGNIIGTSTGESAYLAAKAEKEQGTLLGKMGIGSIPWYVWGAGAAGAIALVYVMATGKKKTPPVPAQPPVV